MSRASKLVSYRALSRVTPSRAGQIRFNNAASSATTTAACTIVSPAPSPSMACSHYYNQAAVDAAAAKNSVLLTPASLLYSGRAADSHQVLRSAQYLQRELPVRIAHRVADFRALPFVVGCHPTLLAVHELYLRAFHILSNTPTLTEPEDEIQYSGLLRQLLDEHKDVVTMLAEGFRECGRHVRDSGLVRTFLDRTLTSRLGIRLLCEHHLALRQEKPDFVGIVGTKFCPGDLVESRAALVTRMCDMKYGQSPTIRVDGNGSKAAFSYIPQPIEYVLTELLKNAFRATVEFHRGRPGPVPEVRVTVANNDVDFVIRISDQGGGVPHEIADKIFDYNFSTAEASEQHESFFDRVSESRSSSSSMHGFGFGLPASLAYARYLGGALTFETMQGVGSDFYLRLRHIDGRGDTFRI
ncbi:hypothetical protein BOX15_Mlig025482g1 [Macrostomum lignano]|uniref:Protein-serine/threonine kinase n=2 Tax=Macrostomum lignano TaxID=282301 RepID=A0A1I8G7X7_9PLAT|nr:hypothetical protein BOX15_Mlig025482g1 [Macrostomum lignano]